MKSRSFIAALLLAVAAACVNSGVNPVGTWTRPVSEADLGVSGTEYLTFCGDSSFSVVSDMELVYSDSVFLCHFGFRSSVSGQWAYADGCIRMCYDSSAFLLDTIPGCVAIRGVEGPLSDSVAVAMARDLKSGLSEYYRSVYEGMSAPEGLLLKGVALSGDTFGAHLDDSSIVRWKRVSGTCPL